LGSRANEITKGAASAEQEIATLLAADIGTLTNSAEAKFEIADRKQREETSPGPDAISELQAIYEAAPVGLSVLDLDLHWVRINAKMAETNGIAAEAHIGRSVYELTPGIADPVAAAVRRVVETGESFSGEVSGETPARPGVRRAWEVTCRPIRNSTGRIAAILVIAEEITDARAGEEQRRHLFRLIEQSNALIALAAPDGRVTYINRAGRRIVGLAEDAPLDEVLLGDSLAPAWREAFFGDVLPTVRDAGMWVGETQLVNRLTGRKVDAHRSIFALHDHEGELAGYGIVIRDITDAKASQAALAKSEAQLRSVLESTTDSVFTLSPDWRFTFLNRRAIEQISAPHDLIGQVIWEAFPDRVGSAGWETYRRCMTDRAPAEAERTYAGRHYIVRAFPSADGGITVFFRDVTEERGAASRAAAAEGLVRILGESTPDLLFAKDRECRMVYANPATLAVIGREPSDVIGRSEVEWSYDPAQAAAVIENDRRIMESGVSETVEETFFDAVRGKDRLFQATKAPLRDPATGAVTGLVGVGRDITEQRSTEQALAESEARLRLATKAGGIGVFDWNVRTGEIRWDERMHELWSLPKDAEVRIETFFASLHAEDRKWVEAANLAALDPAGSGEYEAEYRIIGVTDGRERRVAARGKVTFQNGAATRMVGTVVDRTALRMAEAVLARDRAELETLVAARTQDLQQTQARLAQAEKLTALGQLAGGVAHDFNNVLQAVQGGARLIERKPEDSDNVRRLARMVFDAAERGSSVSRRLLSFSRHGDLRATPVDPASLLNDMREVLIHTLGAGVAIRVEAPADLPPMFVDKGQLETVLINLAANARDAMAGAGTLTLSADVDRVETGDLPDVATSLKPGAYLRFAVRDTGVGMSPEVLARATEPFFTTKTNGQGTGLGLATVRGFAEQSGGGMRIESAPGGGAVVTLWLPLATRTEAPAPSSSETAASPERRTIRLAVADDDPLVRALLAEQLRSAGYDVTACLDPAMALALLDAGESFDLMIADLSMPGMDGIALIREARLRQPGMPAILLTGYATEAAEVPGGNASAGAFAILRKPASERQLTKCIEMLLRAPSNHSGSLTPRPRVRRHIGE
jgi:PAS domain S-box-containing protein